MVLTGRGECGKSLKGELIEVSESGPICLEFEEVCFLPRSPLMGLREWIEASSVGDSYVTETAAPRGD